MTWAPGTQWPASAELEAVAAAREITLGELVEQMEVTRSLSFAMLEDTMAAAEPPPPPPKRTRASKAKPPKREDTRPAWLFRGDAVTDELKALLKRAAAEDPKETEAEIAMRGIRAAAMAKLQGTTIGGEPEPQPVGRPGLPAVPDVASMVAELRAEMKADREAVAELRAALAEQQRRQEWRRPKMMPEAVMRVINTLTRKRQGGDE